MTPPSFATRRLAPLISLCLAVLAIAAPAVADPGLDGTWVLSLAKSGPHRQIKETVVIAHEGEDEIYSAEVTFNGEVTGARYRAKPDGRPYPLYDLKSGADVGTVVMKPKKPGVISVTLTLSGAERRTINIEHWLTQGGATLISLLKNDRGDVTSVLVFDRQ